MRAQIERLDGPGGALMREMIEHHLGWDAHGAEAPDQPSAIKGKLVRPRLCLLSCAAVGGDAIVAAPAAAAVELLHNYSLIHDDIEDRDEMRRGRPTVWRVWGEAPAINTGDVVHALAFNVLGALQARGVEHTRCLRAPAILAHASVRLCEGQAHDLALQGEEDIAEAQYLDMVERKTGALMSAAAELGALLGGASESHAAAFGDFGLRLGLAFQIRDDILGIWGEAEKTGKPVGADISRKRCSYPIIWALAQAKGDERKCIIAARAPAGAPAASPALITNAVAALERAGARARAEQLAAEYHQRAWAALADITLAPQPAAQLHRLADFLAARER
jgi:geranylgeranyl diphosphate synthase type I